MPSRRATPGTIAALAVVAAMAALVTWTLTRPAPPASLWPSRFEIVPAPAQALFPATDRDIAISPDGHFIVYRGGVGGAQLIVRAIERLDAHPVSIGGNARQPFFSPDSQWIGFFDGLTLKKVSIAGGAAISICQSAITRGASWGDDDRIVFATTDTTRGLLQVSAGGGEPAVLTTPDPAKGETNHWYPSVLPGGRGVLFTITARNAAATAQVAVLDLKTGEHKTLIRGSQPEYAQGGHLLYVADGTLHAVRFDLERLELLGDPVPVVDGVWTAGGGAANYGVARTGTLVYVPAGTQTQQSLVWVDRKGKETPIPVPLRVYDDLRLSPDGTLLALALRDQDNDIYILDLAREALALRRLTFGPGSDASPMWTPDGHAIVFGSQGADATVANLFVQAADGTGTANRLTTGQHWQTPSSITPDGTRIVGWENSARTAGDIFWFPLRSPASPSGSGPVPDSSPSEVEPLIRTTFIESNPEISPNGRYIAYQSNESGRYEIYVRPFPLVDKGRWQPSSGGGTNPAWARNGRELFYLDPENRLTSVLVKASGATFTAGNPVRVLDTAYAAPLGTSRAYDVSVDGQRFLMIKEHVAGEPTPAGMIVVLNWFEELKAKVSR